MLFRERGSTKQEASGRLPDLLQEQSSNVWRMNNLMNTSISSYVDKVDEFDWVKMAIPPGLEPGPQIRNPRPMIGHTTPQKIRIKILEG